MNSKQRSGGAGEIIIDLPSNCQVSIWAFTGAEAVVYLVALGLLNVRGSEQLKGKIKWILYTYTLLIMLQPCL